MQAKHVPGAQGYAKHEIAGNVYAKSVFVNWDDLFVQVVVTDYETFGVVLAGILDPNTVLLSCQVFIREAFDDSSLESWTGNIRVANDGVGAPDICSTNQLDVVTPLASSKTYASQSQNLTVISTDDEPGDLYFSTDQGSPALDGTQGRAEVRVVLLSLAEGE